MQHPIGLAAFLLLLLAVSGDRAAAQTRDYRRDVPPKLAAQAKISEERALQTARLKFPQARIVALELEQEHGELLYSIDLQVPGADGVDELHISAVDGRVLSQEHESSKMEREESKTEKKERKAQLAPDPASR
jgi:hypothetical protein